MSSRSSFGLMMIADMKVEDSMEKLNKILAVLTAFVKGIKQKPSSVILAVLTIILGVPDFQSWSQKHRVLYYLYLLFLALAFFWDIYGQGEGIVEKDKELTILNNELQVEKNKNEILLESLSSIPEDFLELVFGELKFNSSERISLYTFRENKFVIAGRYSSVRYLQSKGRASYPEKVGYIGKAWEKPDRNDSFYRCDLPSFEKEKDKYLRTVSDETGMKEEELENLTMCSSCYYVKIVREHNYPVGIIVLESINKRFPMNKDQITSILNGMSGKHLAALIKVNKNANNNGGENGAE